jgi:hypothetical protein
MTHPGFDAPTRARVEPLASTLQVGRTDSPNGWNPPGLVPTERQSHHDFQHEEWQSKISRQSPDNHSQLNDSEVENFNLLVSTSVAAPVSASSILLNANKVVPDTLIETVDVRVNQYSMLSRFEIGFKIALNAQVNHIVSEPLYRNSREVINQQATTRMSICVKSMPDETIS